MQTIRMGLISGFGVFLGKAPRGETARQAKSERRIYRQFFPIWQPAPNRAQGRRVNHRVLRKSGEKLRDAFDHAHIALDIAGAEHFQCFFIGGRVVTGGSGSRVRIGGAMSGRRSLAGQLLVLTARK